MGLGALEMTFWRGCDGNNVSPFLFDTRRVYPSLQHRWRPAATEWSAALISGPVHTPLPPIARRLQGRSLCGAPARWRRELCSAGGIQNRHRDGDRDTERPHRKQREWACFPSKPTSSRSMSMACSSAATACRSAARGMWKFAVMRTPWVEIRLHGASRQHDPDAAGAVIDLVPSDRLKARRGQPGS